MSNLYPLEFKRTRPVDLAAPLVRYITLESAETHPAHIEPDAARLNQLRTDIYGQDGVPLVLESSVDKLLTYQAQLTLTMTKFPDTAGPAFAFYPLFSSPANPSIRLPPGALPSTSSSSVNPDEPKHLAPINSLKYELSCALYNLAALYTHLALQNRSKHHPNNDSEAFRTSVNHFQSALGTLDKLVSISKTSSRRGDVDVARQTLEGWREYVKGCIQEIGWQKAVADRLKNGTIAKLAKQVSIHYETCWTAFASDQDYLPSEWEKFLKLKKNHFDAVAQYRRSLDDLGANRYGDEIGRLSYAVDLLRTSLAATSATASSSGKIAKGTVLDTASRDSKGFLSVLEENLKRANKDNDLIYLASPTPLSSLSPIAPFPLSRSTPPLLVASPFEALPARDKVFEAIERKEVGQALKVWHDRRLNWWQKRVEREWLKRTHTELDELSHAILTSHFLFLTALRCLIRSVFTEYLLIARILRTFGLPASLEIEQDEDDEPSEVLSGEAGKDEEEKRHAHRVTSSSSPHVPQHVIDRSEEVARLGGTRRLTHLFRDVQKVSQLNRQLLQEANEYLLNDREAPQQPSKGRRAGVDGTSETAKFRQSLRERSDYFSRLIAQASESDSLVRQKYSGCCQHLTVLEGGPTTIAAALPPAVVSPTSMTGSTATSRSTSTPKKTRSEATRVVKRTDLDDLVRMRRELTRVIDDLREVQEEGKDFALRVIKPRIGVDEPMSRATSEWDLRSQIVEKSRQLVAAAAARERDSQDSHDADTYGDDQEGGGLADFEEVLSEGMERLKRTFEGEIESNEKRHRDLIDALKTLNSSFVSLAAKRREAVSRNRKQQAQCSALDDASRASSNDGGEGERTKRRQDVLQQFSLAHAKFLEILNNLEEGLKFYADLSKLLSDLRDQSKQLAYSETTKRESTQVENTQTARAESDPATSTRLRPSPTTLTTPAEREEGQTTLDPEEEEEEEEEDPIPEDPISRALSNPIGAPRTSHAPRERKTVPSTRRSDRQDTSQRKAKRSEDVGVAEDEEAGRDGERESAREGAEVLQPQTAAAAQAANSGWDPSMGIRFG